MCNEALQHMKSEMSSAASMTPLPAYLRPRTCQRADGGHSPRSIRTILEAYRVDPKRINDTHLGGIAVRQAPATIMPRSGYVHYLYGPTG